MYVSIRGGMNGMQPIERGAGAVRSVRRPRIGRSLALRRPWSFSIRTRSVNATVPLILTGVGLNQCPIEGVVMSVYKVVELVGTSPTSWEDAAKSAVAAASQSLRDLRIAEVSDLDMQIDDGVVVAYRAKVKVSFKHEAGG